MKSRNRVIVLGVVALVLAAVGTVTSLSVVLAGGTEGGVYLTVNVLLAALGVFLLFRGLRRIRRTETRRTDHA